MKNKTLLYVLGAGAVVAGIWYFVRPKPQEDTIVTPEIPPAPGIPPVLPSTPPTTIPPTEPVLPTVLNVGDTVLAKSTAVMYKGKGLISAFRDGKYLIDDVSSPYVPWYGGIAYEKVSVIPANQYAGKILEIDNVYNSVKVQNQTYWAKEGDTVITSYWVKKSALKKQ